MALHHHYDNDDGGGGQSHGGGSDAHYRRHAVPFATTMRVAMQRVRCMYQLPRTFAVTGHGSTSIQLSGKACLTAARKADFFRISSGRL